MKEALLFALIILGSSQPATAAEDTGAIVDRGIVWGCNVYGCRDHAIPADKVMPVERGYMWLDRGKKI